MRTFTSLTTLLLFILSAFLIHSQDRRVKVISKEKRLALVIGNNDYAPGQLANAANDSRAIRDTLKQVDFEVTYLENSNLRLIITAVQDFGDKLKKGGVGLFYFSGHGVQIKGQNFLLPVGANIRNEGDVSFECYPAERILSTMESAGNRLNIVILDACRNNPFARTFSRSFSRGLAQMQSGKGMLIAYSTSPGETASDGPGMKNGLFTYHLIEIMKTPGLSLSKVFDITREKVYKSSQGNQLPWTSSSVIGDFIFLPVSSGSSPTPTTPDEEGKFPPNVTDIDINEIKAKDKKKKTAWANWQKKFMENINKLKQVDKDAGISASTKEEAWQALLNNYNQDNPFSKKDEALRKYIKERMYYWQLYQIPYLRFLLRITKKIFKNSKGFWEAEFDYNILMVYIPVGEFTMGSNEIRLLRQPVHKVFLDGYWIGKTEVTVGQFKIFVNETNYKTEAEKSGGGYVYTGVKDEQKHDASWRNPYFNQNDDHPVVCVSWNDAFEFCKWLSKKSGLNFKLPTEAQWEKAARGTDGRKYPWGNSPPDGNKVNFADIQFWNKYKKFWIKNKRQVDKSSDDGYYTTSPVSSYRSGASPYGILDIAGNVWEWCSDWWSESYYSNSPYKNPTGPSMTSPSGRRRRSSRYSRRVCRGGSFKDYPNRLLSALHSYFTPSRGDNNVGFRLAMTER